MPEDSDGWEFYFILFRQRHLEDLWREALRELGPLPRFEPGSPAIRLLQSVYAEARLGAIQDGYRASSLLYGFVMELMRSGFTHKHQKTSWPEAVRLAVSYIDEHYRELEGLDDIAAASGSSKYHLSRMFKASTGLSPMAYAAKVRIEKAVQLLRSTELTVEEIAREVGYANGSYFSKAFRGRTGFPPSEFRDGKELPAFNRIIFD
ncbi:helix-turn-helix domain-containing protein [Paenibacillus thailandensis]|uniref:Helix-turn-helix domain-containing protein n=1 Tax=Paenibacillus thailandensis TaxID=393250 RepID=A0ABW5QWX6_9BACL